MFEFIKSLRMSTKIVAFMAIIMIAILSANYAMIIPRHRAAAEEAMVEKAAVFTALAEETKDYAAALVEEDSIAIEELTEELTASVDQGGDFRDSRFFKTIPVIVGWHTAKAAAEKEGLEFNVVAQDARNKGLQPDSTSFRGRMLADLNQTVAAGGDTYLSRVNEETNSLHYMRSIRLSQACMMCHGKPGNQWDQDGDGIDLLGYKMESWKPGDYHGAWEIVTPLAPLDEQVAGFMMGGLMWSVPLLLVGIFIFTRFLGGTFSRPFKTLVSGFGEASQGRLDTRVPPAGKSEMGQLAASFNSFVGGLQQNISQVTSGVEEIDSGSEQVSDASMQLAGSAARQAASLEEISAALEEVSGMAQQGSANVRQADVLASEAQSSAGKGSSEMERLTAAMSDIQDSSSEVSQIIKVIDDIAFQTNLLALNAAVEAARAGEAGKGFAVVAEEVRTLAQRSAEAAKSTSEKIAESSSRAERGANIADVVKDSLADIVTGTEKVSALLSEVASASVEQAQGLDQITSGLSALDQSTQQNAASAEELSAAAAKTAGEVVTVRQALQQYEVGAGAQHAPAPAAQAPSTFEAAPVLPGGSGGGMMLPMDDDEDALYGNEPAGFASEDDLANF